VPKFACCLLYDIHAVRLAVSPNAKIKGVSKNSPIIVSGFWTKVHQILGACRGVPGDWHVSFRLFISLQRYVWPKFKVGSKKAFFCPQPMGVNARGSSDQIFQIAVTSVQVWLRSVQWLKRLDVKKEERKKTTVVKYKPFGITVPCRLTCMSVLNVRPKCMMDRSHAYAKPLTTELTTFATRMH